MKFIPTLNSLLIFFINCYQNTISKVLPPRCRFYPSCSAYSKEAINTYGVSKGLQLSIKRLSKCHPFHPGGIDVLKGEC
ncbi:membrane protein insertion efficiency factor YidD [Candidatus Marinamargulisbacteria bacterium SCGC AAA071-K20]|nr:membrane protein insertion efficiency factor YidD [Candidatus Marinamargulisbacteria bacterium SCGC AAA071-K20]